ncbi:failed axon connections homolog [Ylistrum balloti]|uniref:failed axon connections homolog n=1 Tax=Ylistrum balloti TaxID=509963 RepID=UPI002905C845|nr:failed axon connections homolog [Ylistrum balloti]
MAEVKENWKPEWKRDVVYLHVFPRTMAKCVPNISPFAMKLEMWLRMNNVPYQCSLLTCLNRFIIEYLSKYFKKNPYPGINPEQQAIGRSFLKMAEENTVWSIFWYRYVEHMTEYRKYLTFQVPEEMQEKVGAGLSSSVKDRAWKHGIGRHSSKEIYKLGSDDIRAISSFLGEKKYFLGDTPSLVDCTLFGVLSQAIFVPLDFPMKAVIKEECSNILDYIDRLKTEFWSHWDDQQI